jgi:hypothetical protein
MVFLKLGTPKADPSVWEDDFIIKITQAENAENDYIRNHLINDEVCEIVHIPAPKFLNSIQDYIKLLSGAFYDYVITDLIAVPSHVVIALMKEYPTTKFYVIANVQNVKDLSTEMCYTLFKKDSSFLIQYILTENGLVYA